jgi:hypothetical protein
MIDQEALALIAVSLEALQHRRICIGEQALRCLPVELIAQPLHRLEDGGADTSSLRAEFREEGFDFSKEHEPNNSEPKTENADIFNKHLFCWHL